MAGGTYCKGEPIGEESSRMDEGGSGVQKRTRGLRNAKIAQFNVQ